MSSLPPPRKRRRRRPARSCEQCRRRKIRCDQAQPCAGCVRARHSLLCTYRDDALDIAHARSQVRDVLPKAASIGSVTESSASVTALEPPPPRPSLPEPLESPQTTSNIPVGEHTPAQSTSTAIPPVTPRLRHVPEKTKLFGPTHWLHLAEKFPVTGKFHPVEVEPSFQDAKTELLDALKETRALRFAIKSQESVTLQAPVQDLISTFPPKGTSDTLVKCYLRTFEPLYRIIHIPSFWKDYNHIWDSQSSDSVPKPFLVKLTLILAIGTTFCAPKDEGEASNHRYLAQTWLQNAQWWLTGPAEKTTYNLDGLQIFCLLLLARQTTYNAPGATSWLSTGSLLRMAFTMGLHRNPKVFTSLSPYQREFRSRLWATVLELSVLSCPELGLPVQLSPNDYDAPPPSNYNDVDLDPGSKALPDPSATLTDSSLQILLAKSLPLRIEAIRFLNDFHAEKSYETALKLGNDLRTACREVAAFFNLYQTSLENPDTRLSVKITDFHRKTIDVHLRRLILHLHREFMTRARKDLRFYFARKVCVESAMVIVSSSDMDLALPTSELSDLSRLSVVGRGVFKGPLNFDAILVLALEIMTQLEEAASNKEADALDEMNKATRAPLIKILEDIQTQLTHMLGRRTTSLKRILFLGAYLSQIRAMEAGRPTKPAIYETVTALLRKCIEALREIKVGETPQDSATTDSLMADLFPLDFDVADFDTNWDISHLIHIPSFEPSM